MLKYDSGSNAVYLGRGDLHDTQFNSFQRYEKLNEAVSNLKYRYSGAPMDTEMCPFSIIIYPSEMFESYHTTHNAVVFAVAIIIVFAFVLMVFVLYDINVEKRQKLVLNTAQKTNDIVSSLFPSIIRNQMLTNNDQSKANENQRKTSDFLSKRYVDGDTQPGDSSAALANLYPETTVFFADLAGFTAWSRYTYT